MEVWRPCSRHERYEVSSEGRVRNTKTGKVLKPRAQTRTKHAGGKGYHRVGLPGHPDAYIHQLVAETFHGPRPIGAQADHINCDTHDNRAANVRWLKKIKNITRHEPEPEGFTPMSEEEIHEWKRELESAGW